MKHIFEIDTNSCGVYEHLFYNNRWGKKLRLQHRRTSLFAILIFHEEKVRAVNWVEQGPTLFPESCLISMTALHPGFLSNRALYVRTGTTNLISQKSSESANRQNTLYSGFIVEILVVWFWTETCLITKKESHQVAKARQLKRYRLAKNKFRMILDWNYGYCMLSD